MQVALPLAVGAAIYVLWRSPHLHFFRWIDALGLHGEVWAARTLAHPWRRWIPDFVLFSVPDGAWAYAWTAHFALLWKSATTRAWLVWALLGPLALIASELGQAAHWVPGTFDWIDLVTVSVATALAILPAWRGRKIMIRTPEGVCE